MANPKKVLIIEDDTALRRSLSACLEDAGYQVLEAGGGRQGLQVFEKERPAAIVTDLRMSDLDGFAVISGVKAQSPGTPVIVVSGTGDTTLIEEAVSLGAVAGLRKPLTDLGELEAVINRVIGKPLP